MADLFPGFAKKMIATSGATIHARIGGEGPPLLMLHGYPETHATWSKIAPQLAEHFTCVVPDLRGYGESSMPEFLPGAYSKREMARDMVEVMAELGHRSFHLLGQDRGGRVAYRLALDTPSAVKSLAIIDLVPTYEMWQRWNAALALRAYHWTFLAQPYPLPERMILADARAYLDWTLASWTMDKTLNALSEDALAHYRSVTTDPDRIRVWCEDYRNGATIDRDTDEADLAAGRKITAPFHYLTTQTNFAASKEADPLATWRRWASNIVSHETVVSGHFPQEEAPEETVKSLLGFFRAQAGV